MSGSPDYTTTPNLGLYRPNYDMDDGLWGTHLNANADVLDSVIGSLQASAGTVVSVLDHGAKGDGTTDDTAAIQTAINGAAGKAVVFVPATGNPYMTSGLTLPSGTDLLLHGTIKLLPNSPAGVVSAVNMNSIVIRGNGVIDGNITAQTTHPGGMAGLAISSCSNVRVSGITLQNTYHWPFNITVTNNCVLNGITVTGTAQSASEFAAGCSDCWLVNSMIDGMNNIDYAFAFYGGVTNSGAIGNTIKNAAVASAGTTISPGIGIDTDAGQPAPSSNITIADNIIHDCSGPGISVLGLPGSLATGIVISNNRCYNNNKIGNGGVGGATIFVDYAADVTIVGNQLSANGSSAGTAFCGIFLGPQAARVGIFSNQIFNIGQGTTTGAGIWNDAANNVCVSGNWIYDHQTTHTMQYSVIGGSGTDTVYVGNFFDLPPNFGPAADTLAANIANGQFQFGSQGKPADLRVGMNGAGGYNRLLEFQTNGSPRWQVGAEGTAEGGSNSGTNFVIAALNDAGVYLNEPLTIGRSNGIVSLLHAPIINTPPINAANDAAAASAGIGVGGVYRNGSVLMMRIV